MGNVHKFITSVSEFTTRDYFLYGNLIKPGFWKCYSKPVLHLLPSSQQTKLYEVTMVPPLLILGLGIPYHRGRIKSDLKLTVRHRFGDGGRLCFPNLSATTSAISNVLRTKP